MLDLLYSDEMSGHDSQVRSVEIDPAERTVTVCLMAYPSYQAPERVPLTVHFSDVTAVNMIADLTEMADNHGPGNVQFWNVAKGAGTSYFYVTQGCLAITSETAPTLVD
ncbi:hypothetical protein [Novosphingobium sp. PASSN1]|uniref:hypothetical protein n=1 Tax=Novosphingobium sp. PASSN1 TaxID=2015561 RepID=UPI0025D540CE|nr:hypothetical protein [Novosphingobium sp. PASSN1]